MGMSIATNLGRIKVGIAAIAAIAVVSGLGSTPTGQRLFAQFGISDSLARTADAAQRVAQNSSNAVQAFLGRSPGERGAVDALKGKAKRDLATNTAKPAGEKPRQRALGKIFEEPLKSLAGPLAPSPVVEFLPLEANSATSLLPVALSLPVGGGNFSPILGGGPTGGGFLGGGGGGGGPDGPGTVLVPPTAPPIAAAVPEPSTWVLLLMGFAAVGASIRRKNTARALTPERVGMCAPT